MPSSLNGTGVTFNDGTTLQSGNIPAANLGSGTANASTVLRGDRTFGAPPAPTTAQVLSATAAAAFGAVGTYAFLRPTATTDITQGSTHAGSGLRPNGGVTSTSSGSATMSDGTAPAGTWRAMGRRRIDTQNYGLQTFAATLFLRIS